jgi:hypothetical protein
VCWTLAGLALLITGIAIVGYLRKLPELENRILLTALAAALAAGILSAARMGALTPRLCSVAVLGLILFELANVTTYYLPNRAEPERNPYLRRMRENSDLVDYIRSRGIGARIGYADQEIPYNIGDWYGIETVNAYSASVLENVWKMDLFSQRGQDFFGIRYYLGKKPERPSQVEVFQGQSGLKVYENPTAFPRTWGVHEWTVAGTVQQARKIFSSEAFDPLRAAIVVGASPPLERCESDEENVQMPIHQPNYIHVTARMACRGVVIVTDSWFPGWKATVDGESAPVIEVDGGVRGIVVAKGAHQIDLKYRPWSVLIGGLLTMLAAGVTGLVSWKEN